MRIAVVLFSYYLLDTDIDIATDIWHELPDIIFVTNTDYLYWYYTWRMDTDYRTYTNY